MAGSALSRCDHVEQHPDVAVGGVGDEHVDAGLDQRRRPLPGVAEVADRRADHQPAVGVLGGVRELLGLHEVLDRDQPAEPALRRRPAAAARACACAAAAVASSRQMPTGPVISGIGVITSSTLVVAHSATGVNRRSRLVMMPSSRLSASTTGRPEMRYSPAELVELLERRVGADGDRVGDDAGLGALDQVDLVGLVLDREVAVQHAEAALAGHRDRHPRLGDGVHRGADQRHLERDLAGQPGRGVDVGRRQVGLARQQQDVVVGQAEGGELVGDSGVVHGVLFVRGAAGPPSYRRA